MECNSVPMDTKQTEHFDNRFSQLSRKIDILLERTKPPLPTMEQIVGDAAEAAARAAGERRRS